jgi:hypothetical protein
MLRAQRDWARLAVNQLQVQPSDSYQTWMRLWLENKYIELKRGKGGSPYGPQRCSMDEDINQSTQRPVIKERRLAFVGFTKRSIEKYVGLINFTCRRSRDGPSLKRFTEPEVFRFRDFEISRLLPIDSSLLEHIPSEVLWRRRHQKLGNTHRVTTSLGVVVRRGNRLFTERLSTLKTGSRDVYTVYGLLYTMNVINIQISDTTRPLIGSPYASGMIRVILGLLEHTVASITSYPYLLDTYSFYRPRCVGATGLPLPH